MPLPQVSYERIKAMLDSEELKYKTDENDGELGVAFENLIVWIGCDEQVLRFYAFWRAQAEDEANFNGFMELAYSCNSELLVPKVIVMGEGTAEAPAKLSMEYYIPISSGLTDKQLNTHFVTAMRAFTSVAEKAEEEFPQLITWKQEEA